MRSARRRAEQPGRRGRPTHTSRSSPPARLDPMRRRPEAEGIRHPDVGRVREEHERVRVVEASVYVGELVFASRERQSGLRNRRRAPVRDDGEVDVPPDVEVERFHHPILSRSLPDRNAAWSRKLVSRTTDRVSRRRRRAGSSSTCATRRGTTTTPSEQAACSSRRTPSSRSSAFGSAPLLPGQPNGLYHGEETQEDFLVLSGECLLLVEGEERRLQAWDFFHCAPNTEHILVGAGEGPCAILMTGTRRPGRPIWYPVSELALRHNAGVETATPRHRRRTPATETSVSSARRTGINCPGRSDTA